jgi:hypothetical protein
MPLRTIPSDVRDEVLAYWAFEKVCLWEATRWLGLGSQEGYEYWTAIYTNRIFPSSYSEYRCPYRHCDWDPAEHVH